MKKLEAALKTGKLITDLMLIVLLLCILVLPISSVGLLQVKKSDSDGVLSQQKAREVDPRTLPSSADLPEDTPEKFNNFNDFENYLLDVYSEDLPEGTESQ